MTKQYWLVKQEPADYSWDDFVRDGRTSWTGVRNFAARNHLKAMREGDEAFYYHSGEGKCVVGIAKVAKAAYPDPTADEDGWVAVDLKPVRPLKQAVTLAAIKAEPALKDMALLRISRLSVQPVKPAEFARIIKLGGG
ncbi:MAG TPA: EVE domain-containing protein [Opitutaceae bacterium]|nr:EVE domain-containing protein [Opitutaceae bacterium]